jgi:hypothetical protein
LEDKIYSGYAEVAKQLRRLAGYGVGYEEAEVCEELSVLS